MSTNPKPNPFEVFRLISNEVERARHSMPGRDDMFVALMEEVGELAEALIDQKYKAGMWKKTQAGYKKFVLGNANAHVLTEAVQVAAMAVRILTEGDAAFKYEPPPEIKHTAPRMGWGKGEPIP